MYFKNSTKYLLHRWVLYHKGYANLMKRLLKESHKFEVLNRKHFDFYGKILNVLQTFSVVNLEVSNFLNRTFYSLKMAMTKSSLKLVEALGYRKMSTTRRENSQDILQVWKLYIHTGVGIAFLRWNPADAVPLLLLFRDVIFLPVITFERCISIGGSNFHSRTEQVEKFYPMEY